MHLSRFDLTVLGAALTLLAAIVLTLFLGTSDAALRVAYLKETASGLYQLWLADAGDPSNREQVTSATFGVLDYNVSSDGRYIAYSERDFQSGIADLYLLDLRTGSVRRLTNCIMEDADCDAPVFRPGKGIIAYQRRTLNTDLETGVGNLRIWLLDISTDPPSTYPLFDDSQILGYSPVWSADGNHLAFYDTVNAGILVYDFAANTTEGDPPLKFVPTGMGEVGSLSPDGTQMIFPEMLLAGNQSRSYLQLADLESGVFETLFDPSTPTDDQQTAWSPDGRYIAFGRQYWDERYTAGAQVYLLDMQDRSVAPLIVDNTYFNAFFAWSPDGKSIALQRFANLPPTDPNYGSNSTEVWTYNLETRQMALIDDAARAPQWVAGD